MSQAIAHTVKTARDVAATFHLEPNHNPKAGETTTVWFALTQAGGQPIPLGECNCRLEVKQVEQVIDTVPLQPISAEQYQDIPGGNVVFPKVGIYQLIFSGSAKDGESFQPFALQYDVTVQPGNAIAVASPNAVTATAATADPVDRPPASTLFKPIGLGLMGVAIMLLGIVLWLRSD